MRKKADTICAIATPSGRGGVGVIRLSGPQSLEIARELYSPLPPPRQASLRNLPDASGEVIDEGLVISFPGPHSFTGEDVVEIQSHGSPVVLKLILDSLLAKGARLAEPGEFSKRAYLNDRIDLVQAEAIADLIEASTEQAARAAQMSLQGVFSEQINALVNDLVELRVYVEASLDFPDEDVDFLADGQVAKKAQDLLSRLEGLTTQAKQGERLTSGARIALVGEPNAGKSSLLNALAGRDAAIVTELAGTTRDVVTEHINLLGVPVSIADTAGLRETKDPVESIGIERAGQEMNQADLIVWLIDGQSLEGEIGDQEALSHHPAAQQLVKDYPQLQAFDRVLPVVNKVDLLPVEPGLHNGVAYLSAKTGEGLSALKTLIAERLGVLDLGEGVFSARARHLDALSQAQAALEQGVGDITQTGSGELLAESLREAAQALGEITGQMSADELLGRIFSSFCIGK